ncbi:nitrous oxide-stimulated promoter family protein [Shewanella sp. Isolate11]|uniref:nitrous oxide-stimulated promoter family protein n=1 Tax=Shewanella sp. Isolate11 TaxID=2908530 RepID=UPI001EFD8559|nr:nitrous oxide-stimulated promoter family protein [Shewanella sp. Isolate11]MCG9695391.1 nitrous oxide-stimulated promoter family protein [Shewanella sp. Isolate11]
MVSPVLNGKLQQEFQTITAMVQIYCKDHCAAKGKLDQCQQCQAFLEYAHTRLDRCPYGQQKPTCNKCPVHCYKPELKAKAREIMIYAGPRMLLPHPIMAIRHLIAERFGEVPGKPPAGASNRHVRLEKDKGGR